MPENPGVPVRLTLIPVVDTKDTLSVQPPTASLPPIFFTSQLIDIVSPGLYVF